MHGRIEVVLEGQKVQLWFNNYSKVELGKQILEGEGKFTPKPDELLIVKKVNEMAQENYLLLLRAILYAGIIGYAYGTDTAPRYDRKKISEIIAEIDSTTVYAIWTTFLQAYGFDTFLDKGEEENDDEEGEKKKTKVTS